MAILRIVKPKLLNPFKYAFISKFLSTAAEQQEVHLSKFRTGEQDPMKHSQDHSGMFYTVEQETYKQIFNYGGLTNSFKKNVTTFNECCLMVRPFSLEIINYMSKIDYSLPCVRFILYGEPGVGKTASLAHLIHYANANKMLILHVPSASNWIKRPRETVVSTFNPEFMDTPYDAAVWLKHFASQNAQLLNELNLKTSRTYTWSKREITEKGQSLLNIVEHGVSRPNHASDCVAVLVKEIKEQSSSGSFRTFVAVDGVNAFFSTTKIKKLDKSFYEPEQVTIIRAFLKLFNNDWNNSAVVVIADVIASPIEYKLKQFHTPLKLLGKKGFEVFEPFVPIEVIKYNRKEILSCLDYYIDRNWIQNEKLHSDKGKEELIFLSGSNPYDLMDICNYR